ncbi:MAG: hypothetical protein PQJ46_14755, partial [Spirochaetales bacterium]|nr:hypothetical protein [Spirochaetales bacterium]
MGIIENIPNDLIEYLKSSSNKKYETKEAGPFEFINQDDIELHLIPTDIDNSESFENDEVIYGNENDPHYKEMGCYLVKCINLVKDCEYYDPFGLLIWLPDYKCYGIWDNSHFVVYKFRNDVSWNE